MDLIQTEEQRKAALRQKLHAKINGFREDRTSNSVKQAKAEKAAAANNNTPETAGASESADSSNQKKQSKKKAKKLQSKKGRQQLMKWIEQLSTQHPDLKDMLLSKLHSGQGVNPAALQSEILRYLSKNTGGFAMPDLSALQVADVTEASEDGEIEEIAAETRQPEYDSQGHVLMPQPNFD